MHIQSWRYQSKRQNVSAQTYPHSGQVAAVVLVVLMDSEDGVLCTPPSYPISSPISADRLPWGNKGPEGNESPEMAVNFTPGL